jgi:hypothetical protein
MTGPDQAPLLIDLSGPGWQALLTVQPPPRGEVRKPVEFDVPAAAVEDGRPARSQAVSAEVLFTTATNQHDGWPRWHVKIYLCRVEGDANVLLEYLRRQALALGRANSHLPAPDGRSPIEPPWAVVPVQVVRGDGSVEKGADAVTTRLGTPSELIHAQVDKGFPGWFTDHGPPHLQLLAISPEIDPGQWETYRQRPATEELAGFTMLATGLDELHRGHWAHCDIKPANVCWSTNPHGSGYVLIDTDAATQAEPPPAGLRLTPLYRYQGIPRQEPRQLRAGLLYAQDRFGFVTVVLSALAGRSWVDSVLLRADPASTGERRVADSEPAVVAALRQQWPDRRWEPLIRAVAAPFGTTERGPVLEAPGPWAAGWLAWVIAAEEQCLPGGRRPEGPGPAPAASAFRAEIEEIRRYATRMPAPGPERLRLAYEAIARGAHTVALRRARFWASVWGAGLTLAAAAVAMMVGG